MNISVTTQPAEILKGKFAKTLMTIEGYTKEAEGDISIGTGYRASGVYNRMNDIRTAFLQDLENLAREIKITPSSGGE